MCYCLCTYTYIHHDEKFGAAGMQECYSFLKRCGQTSFSRDDLHKPQSWHPCHFFCFYFLFFLMYIHVHSMIITTIYTGHCCGANPTELLYSGITITSPVITVPLKEHLSLRGTSPFNSRLCALS